jgi:hypothetical protein
MPREGNQVRVAKTVAYFGSLTKHGVRASGVALDEALERHGQEQIALLHAVVRGIVEQSSGSGDPGATASSFAVVYESESQPERASGGSFHVAPAQEPLMRARPGVGAVDVLAAQVRRRREPLEIVRLENVVPVGRREMRMSI